MKNIFGLPARVGHLSAVKWTDTNYEDLLV
jgi:hypothetical protein